MLAFVGDTAHNIPMKRLMLAAVLLCLLVGVSGLVYARTYSLYTTTGFVELLIERGIVPEPLAGTARALASAIERIEHMRSGTREVAAPDPVTVEVSQFIEHGDLTYDEGEDIEGLLLTVKNGGSDSLALDAVRGCQVVYRIYREQEQLYDSRETERCKTDELVVWELSPGELRMFPVRHSVADLALLPGVYRFELEYPGYGKGSREITVR